MKVKELIEKLKKFNPEAKVLVEYSNGADTPEDVYEDVDGVLIN